MNLPPDILTAMTRRNFFGRSARGLGTVALASLLEPGLLAGGVGNRA